MSKRRIVAAIFVVAIAIGIVALWPQGQSVPPASRENAEETQALRRQALSSVAPPVTTAATTPDNELEECPRKMTQDEIEDRDAKLQEHFRSIAKQLARSDDAENLLAAALLLQGDPGSVPLDTLDRAFRLAPRSPLVAWNMLRVCRDNEVADCDLDIVEANAIRADGDNGAVWMEIAILRLEEGNPDEAVAAARNAIAAPRFDSYFIDHARLIERALEAGGDSTYTERMSTGIGYSAALVVSYQKITSHCRTLDAADAVWIDLCHQIGEKMLSDGRILFDQAIGSSLVKIATERTQDTERIRAATERESEFRAQYQSLIASVGTQNLLANDEAVLREYVENFATFGEMEAMTSLAQEAAMLRETDGYDQCNFVNPVTGL